MTITQKITPFLWFNENAEEAAELYVNVFPNSKILSKHYYPKDFPNLGGKIMTVSFELNSLQFTALNGGPRYSFTEAVSFVVNCDTQEEIDHYWDSFLAQGGKELACGWIKDPFGLAWQIVPSALAKYLSGNDKTRSERVMQALWGMNKLIIADLEKAYTQ